MNVRSRIPLFEWAGLYRPDWLRADVVAGLTTAAVVLPNFNLEMAVANYQAQF